jgi:hypothetical protein
LEIFGAKELAYAITMQDYDLFLSINQVENRSSVESERVRAVSPLN